MRYRTPKLKKLREKWFVEYYYRHPETLTYKRFKVYEDINRYEGAERIKYANLLRDAVHAALDMGYDPFEEQDAPQSASMKIERAWTVDELLTEFLQSKVEQRLSHKTIKNYKNFVNHFRPWLEVTGNLNKPASWLKTEILIEHLKYQNAKLDWKGKTYNGHRQKLLIFTNWVRDMGYGEVHIYAKRIPSLKEDITRNEYYHGDIRDQVRAELQKHPVLNRFVQAIYYTCMRPFEELCHITVGDIDWSNRVIKVKNNVGKTGYRYVPICEELEEIFKEMELHKYPLDYYLFSFDALPGPTSVNKMYYTRQYQKIKHELNLGIEYSMYSWKHTRVTDLLQKGYTDAEVMDLTGHRDTGSYDAYKRNLGKKINSKIKGKTMDF